MPGPGASVTTESLDKQSIPRNYKGNKTSETLIKWKESIQEPDNPSKREKWDSIPHEEQHNQKKTQPPFKNKEDYIGDTNDNTRDSNDSPS